MNQLADNYGIDINGIKLLHNKFGLIEIDSNGIVQVRDRNWNRLLLNALNKEFNEEI